MFAPSRLAGLFLVSVGVRAFSQVSISVGWPHNCAQQCINEQYGPGDVGSALSCGEPYNNDCYCATNARAASIVSSFFPSCASSNCASGDEGDDLSAMESIYASYCLGAGYTQPGITAWYNPSPATTSTEPGATSSSGNAAPGTTTQVSVVTQTTTSQPNGADTTTPLVTLHVTSTIFVNPAGSTFPAASHSGTNTVALGAGLGVGIPVALAFAGIFLWFCLRRPKGPPEAGLPPPAVASHLSPDGFAGIPPPQGRQEMAQPPNAPRPQSQILRKAVPGAAVIESAVVSPISTSPSPGFGVGSELTGQDARVEIGSDGRPPELMGANNLPGSPPPAYVQSRQVPVQQMTPGPQHYEQEHYVQGDPRWELP